MWIGLRHVLTNFSKIDRSGGGGGGGVAAAPFSSRRPKNLKLKKFSSASKLLN